MCPLSTLTGVRIKRGLNIEKMYGLSPGTKKTVRNNGGVRFKWVSVKRGSTVLQYTKLE